jgi:hypothetical protein
MASLSNIAVASPSGGQPASTVAATSPKPDPPPLPAVEPALITRHEFNQALEDGWHFRDHRPTEKNFEHGHAGGDGYGQANYPVTLSPGSGPIQLRRTWDATEEVTVETRWQVSPNFHYQTGSRAKKIWFLEAPLVNPIYLALGGHNEIALMTQSTAEGRDGATRMQGGRIEPGRIYDLKVHIKLNSTSPDGRSKPDGVATVWLDDERVIHRVDLRFRGEDSPQASTGRYFRAGDGITGLRWNPTWPGGGKPPRELMWERLYGISVLRGGH